MQKRSCSAPGCVNAHRAKGLCSTHYNQVHARQLETECVACGTVVVKTNQRSRARYRSVCSMECRAYLQHGSTSCAVPASHPSRALACRVPRDHPSRAWSPALEYCTCEWCDATFERHTGGFNYYCTLECRRRAKRARRKGRETDGRTYSWSQVMRVLLLLDGCCAYCDESIDGTPDPDHVVPLSKHGSNGIGNILPVCRPCNSDKRDLLLHEWAVDRERRGKPPVRTTIDRRLPAFAHLLPDAVASASPLSDNAAA